MSSGADESQHATPLHSCYGVFIDRLIFRLNFPGHNCLMTNHKKQIDVTGPEQPFFHQRKGIPKIDQSVKVP